MNDGKSPWYSDGLKFECKGCGDCCTGDPGYVWVNAEEIGQIAAAIGVDVRSFKKTFLRKVGIRWSIVERQNGDCNFFDMINRRCRIYDSRPRQCRTWPFWHSNLKDNTSWEETCKSCPGAGRGPVVPLKEIKRRMGKIRV